MQKNPHSRLSLLFILATGFLCWALSPSNAVLAQQGESDADEVQSPPPDPGRIPIEEAMREFNARYYVVSQTDISDPNNYVYDPTIPGEYHPWPPSLGCGGGESIPTPPKPEEYWYGPLVYEDPIYSTYLVQAIVVAFYGASPVPSNGALYSYFIDPEEAIENATTVSLTEDDFPLTWLESNPAALWSNVGLTIEDIVTVENYLEALDTILAYIRQLAATGNGGGVGWLDGNGLTLQRGFKHGHANSNDGLTIAEQWLAASEEFKSDNIGIASNTYFGTLFHFEYQNESPPGYSATVSYVERIHDFHYQNMDGYIGQTVVTYVEVNYHSYVTNDTQHIPPGMMMLVTEEEFGMWTNLSGISFEVSSGMLDVNDDIFVDAPVDFSRDMPRVPGGTEPLLTGPIDYNSANYGWVLENAAFLTSMYPPIDLSPTPSQDGIGGTNDGMAGGGEGADVDLSDTGDAEIAIDAGNTASGMDAGSFTVVSSTPREDIGSASSLSANIHPSALSGTNNVISNSAGEPRQVMNGEYNSNASSPSDHRVDSLVEIDPMPASPEKYCVEYYTDATWDSTNNEWDSVGDAFRRVTVEDMSGATDGSSVRVIDEQFDGQTVTASCVTEFDWDANEERWILSEGVVNGVATRKRWTENDETEGFRTTTRVITEDNTNTVLSKVEEDFRSIADQWLLVERRVVSGDDGNGADVYASIESWGYSGSGVIETYRHSNGYWEHYLYDQTTGRLAKTITPLGDTGIYDPLDPSSELDHLATTTRYQTDDLSDTHAGVEAIQEYIQWIEDPANPGNAMAVSTAYRVTWSHDPNAADPSYEVWDIACFSADPKAAYAGTDEQQTVAFLNALAGDADHLGHQVTRTVYIAPSVTGRFKVMAIYNPDGTVSLRSSSEVAGVRTRIAERGFPVLDANGVATDIAHGTRTTTTLDMASQVQTVKVEQRVRDGGWVTASLYRTTSSDDRGRSIDYEYFYGSNAVNLGQPDYTSSSVFEGSSLLSRTDRRGLQSTYTYTCLGWAETTVVNAGTSGAMRIGYIYDAAGRVTGMTSQGLDAQGATTTTLRTDETHIYDLAGRILQTTNAVGVSGFKTYRYVNADGSSYDITAGSPGDAVYMEERIYPNDPDGGAVSVTHTNRLGQLVLSYDAELDAGVTDWTTTPTGRPTGAEMLVPKTRTTYAYNWRGVQVRERIYFDLANIAALTAEGTFGVHYIQSESVAFDYLGRPLRSVDSSGTITAAVYDSYGRLIESWVGTDDTGATDSDPSNGGNNNMERVARYFYDDDRDGTGDLMDYVTRSEFIKPSLETLSGNASDFTGVDYELRLNADDEVSWTKPDSGPWQSGRRSYDSLDLEALVTQNGSETNILARSTWHYDVAGKPWRLSARRSYSVENFVAGDYLETTFDYDDAERQFKEFIPEGGWHETVFDARGRAHQLMFKSDIDTVLSQADFIYDEADRVVVTTELARYHDDTTTVGPLGANDGLRSILVNCYDSAGRIDRQIDFGQDNGSTRYVYNTQGGLIDADSDGVPDEADPDASIERLPDESDDYRVTATGFDGLGRVDSFIENDGVETRFTYNAAGWPVRTIENYHNGVANTGDNDRDRITQEGYNSLGQRITVESVLPTGTIVNTRYVYASELSDKGSAVANNNVLRAVIHADSDDSVAANQLADNAGGYDRAEYTYYADGSPRTYTDRRGIEWTSEYTAEGYIDHRRVTATPQSWTPVGEQRISYTYGDAGEMLSATTASDAAGANVTSKVSYSYDGFYTRLTDGQNHDPAVAGGGTTLTVTHGFDTTAVGGRYTRGYRPSQLTYPNGRVITLDYDGHNGIDDTISRANGLSETIDGVSTTITRLSFLGDGVRVRKDYPVAGVRLDFVDEGTEGDSSAEPYDASTSRFGEVARFQWERYDGNGDGAGVTGSSGENIYLATIGRDRVGQSVYRRRHQYTAYSEVYLIDGLRRIAGRDVGMVVVDGQDQVVVSNGAASVELFWQVSGRDAHYDPLGNLESVDTESSSGRSSVAINDANEITTSNSDATNQIDESRVDFNVPGDKDVITEAINCNLATNVTVDSNNDNALTINAGSTSAPAILLTGGDRGPLAFAVRQKNPTGSGLVGIVFGYQSPLDYWVLAINADNGDRELYRVIDDDGNGSIDYNDPDEKVFVGTELDNDTSITSWYVLFARPVANTVDIYRADYDVFDEGGIPSGRFGFYTEASGAQFDYIRTVSDLRVADVGPAWETTSSNCLIDRGASGGGQLFTTGTSWYRQHQPILLRGLRAQRFQATFSLERANASPSSGHFVFNYRGPGDYDSVLLYHQSMGNAPQAQSIRNGNPVQALSEDRLVDNPDPQVLDDPFDDLKVSSSEVLWYRVVSDGIDVKVFASDTESGLDARQAADEWCMRTDALTTQQFAFSDGPGRMGFAGGSWHQYWDNVTIETDSDNDASLTSHDTYDVLEYSDTFDLIPPPVGGSNNRIETSFAYDGNGNLAFDGVFRYAYDALDRLVEVRMAGQDDANPGSLLCSYRYDAVGRLIEEKEYTADGVHLVIHNLFDGWNIIETRDGATGGGHVTSQNVWDHLTGDYIDSLAQIAHNLNPGVDDAAGTVGLQDQVDSRLYVLQDPLANPIGLVTAKGALVERYEFGTNGNRFVYSSGNADYAAFAAADLNNDGIVDASDLGIVTANFNQSVTPGERTRGDVNGDGSCDIDDQNLVTGLTGSLGVGVNDPLTLNPAKTSAPMAFGSQSGLPLMRHGMQGHVQDDLLNLVHMRIRVLNTSTGATGGRFLQRDPAGNVDGENRYVGHFLQRGGTDPMGLATLFEEGLDTARSVLPAMYRSRDKQVDSFIASLGALRRDADQQAEMLGIEVQLVQARHGDCHFEAPPYLPLVDELERTLYNWLSIYETLHTTLADGRGNATQIEELGRTAGMPAALLKSALPPETLADFRQRIADATGELVSGLGAEVSALDDSIAFLEAAQVAANVALMVTGVGTAGVAIVSTARVGIAIGGRQGAKHIAAQLACSGIRVGAGAGASYLARQGVARLHLDPYAEQALNVGLDFFGGALGAKIKACFPAGTIVWVVDEVAGELIPVPIEEAYLYREVVAYHPDTGQWEACCILATHELAYDGEFVDVTYMVDGMGPFTETVSATGNHPFWVDARSPGSTPLTDRPLALHHTGEDAQYVGPTGGRWVQARHLTLGDQLLLKDGRSATVCGLTVRTERTHVYNLTVERLHNYAVGTSGVCVHNGGPCWKQGDSITAPTRNGHDPSWSTVRRRYWRNQGTDGRAPTRQVRVTDRNTGRERTITERKELHHQNGRDGSNPHREDNLQEVWPSEHEAIDPDRHLNYDVDEVIGKLNKMFYGPDVRMVLVLEFAHVSI